MKTEAETSGEAEAEAASLEVLTAEETPVPRGADVISADLRVVVAEAAAADEAARAEEADSAAVTGQIVVKAVMVSVTTPTSVADLENVNIKFSPFSPFSSGIQLTRLGSW